jgi:hypothetical protein
MLGLIIRIVLRILATLMVGAAPGALYASVVGAIHLGVYGQWERVPAFAVGCVLVGALIGLVGGISWAFSSKPSPARVPVATGSQGGTPFLRAPLEMSARPAGSARVARPRCRHPRRARLRPGSDSRGCAPYQGDAPASTPVLDRLRWLAERDRRRHRSG